MESYKSLLLPAAAFTTFRPEIRKANLGGLRRVSAAQVIVGVLLLLPALPGIGLLSMTLPYLCIAGPGVVFVLLSQFVCPRLPVLTLPLYYLETILLLLVTGAMGSVWDTSTNATTFLLVLLLFPLFLTDRPWRLNLLVVLSAALFAVASASCKPRALFLTDLLNIVVVAGMAIAFIATTMRARLNDYVKSHNEKAQLQEKENLINAIPTGIGVYEVRDGVIKQTFINDDYYRLVGDTRAARQARYGGNFINGIHPDDRKSLGAFMDKMLNEDVDYDGMTCRTQRGNGSYLWVRFSAAVARREKNFMLVYSTYISMEDEVRSNEARRQSQLMLEAAMRSANITAWEYDCRTRTAVQSEQDGTPAEADRELANVPESLILAGRVHPDSVATVRRLFSDFAVTNSLCQGDIQINRRGGSGFRWTHLIITPMLGRDNRQQKAIITLLDVNDRKEKEEQYYRQIGLMSDGGDKNIISKAQYNLTKQQLVLYTALRADAVRWETGQTLVDYTKNLAEHLPAAAERTRLMASLSPETLLRRYGEGKQECELVYKRSQPNQPIAYVHNRGLLAADPKTGDVMLFLYAYDDTQRMVERCIVDQLGTSEYAAIGMIDVDTGAYVIDRVNGTHFMELPRFGADYYAGCCPFIERCVLPDELPDMLNRIKLPNILQQLNTVSWYEFPYSIREENGDVRRRRLEFRYLDAEHTALLCTCSDITELYRQEQERLLQTQKALAEAERATAAKTDFLSRMSHDIRTPLNAILGTANIAKEDVNDPAATIEALDTIDASGRVLLGLINDILDINKIESGKIELRPEVVSVADYEKTVRTAITPLMEKKHLTFIMDFRCGQVAIYVDPVRYRQIFFNLLSNSAKYTPDHGTVTYSTQRIPSREGMVGIRSIVKDNGIGITAEYQKHLFEAFTRDSAAEINQTEGSGLGLAIVKNIVEAMGGTITVNSVPGQGSEFVVDLYLPAITPEMLAQAKDVGATAGPGVSELAQIPDLTPQETDAVLARSKILLVEDNAINTRIALKILERKGCTVTTAANGREAVDTLDAAAPGSFDAVLMDIRMPVMNGIDATKAIRASERADLRTIPVIAMTADAFSEDVSRTIAAGMDGHLSKPVEPDKLYAILTRIINQNPQTEGTVRVIPPTVSENASFS